MPAAVLHDVLSAAARRLRDAGLDAADAGADVDVLARHVLGWDRARLLAHRRDAVPAAFIEPFTALVDRRADRVPVAYLTGTREFYGLDFEVTADVLIPRPETELAVEAALEALAAPGLERTRRRRRHRQRLHRGRDRGDPARRRHRRRRSIAGRARRRPAQRAPARRRRSRRAGRGGPAHRALAAPARRRRGVESAVRARPQRGRRARRRPPRAGVGALCRPRRPGRGAAARRRGRTDAPPRRPPRGGDRDRAGRRGRDGGGGAPATGRA